MPPHFHVEKRGEWEIRVYYLECTGTHLEFEMKYPKRGIILARDRDAIIAQVTAHQADLMKEWTSKVCTGESHE